MRLANKPYWFHFKSIHHLNTYIIDFADCDFVPVVRIKDLMNLGKWHISNEGYWVCYSSLAFDKFRETFLKFVDSQDRGKVHVNEEADPFSYIKE